MKRTITHLGVLFVLVFASSVTAFAGDVDVVLNEENKQNGITDAPAPLVDDLAFLRRASVDLIGRIPTVAEIEQFQSWPAAERRGKAVDELIQHDRFADRWMTFYADMFRARSNVTGGNALLAFLNKAIRDDMPYDELARKLIVTNGKANSTPEAGFVLGDNADPMALASATAQVFMGVRMGCAQCHDHPFDVWTQEDFYGLAAYYGKTRRVESRLTRVIYTTETNQSTVLWPPEGGDVEDSDRKAMVPKFPIKLADSDGASKYIARLKELRDKQAAAAAALAAAKQKDVDLDALLSESDDNIKARFNSDSDALGVAGEAKRDLNRLKISGMYKQSILRNQLAEFITSPRNRYFARAFVNRVWGELIGRGFVEPVDDFRDDNPPSHEATLDYLADEFVAHGYDLKHLVRVIATSDTYQRGHVTSEDEQHQIKMEETFLATPMRRILAEAIYDSVVVAGHLFEVKHKPGKNNKTYTNTVRIRVDEEGDEKSDAPKAAAILVQGNRPAMTAMPQMEAMPAGYNLEKAIELNFDKLLAANDQVKIDEMRVMSQEELEAMRMQQEATNRSMPGKFITKTVTRVVDENPQFTSSFRMASPAPAGHIIRVLGQSSRARLDESRDKSPTMRQALLMLNGQLTHQASRVGELEPIYKLLVGKRANLEKAIRLSYIEILTRNPSPAEIDAIVKDAAHALQLIDLAQQQRRCVFGHGSFADHPQVGINRRHKVRAMFGGIIECDRGRQ